MACSGIRHVYVYLAVTVSLDVSAFVPFSVEPETGAIAAGKTADITVKFSPLDVSDYEARLICR